MGTGGLLELKRRIRSVSNTRKITKAMGLVASAKFKRLRDRVEKATPYFQKFNEAVESITKSSYVKSLFYFDENDSDTDVYIIITSDSGLCGNYNANVILSVLDHMYGKKVMLITVGGKGRSFFNAHNYDTIAEFIDIGNTPTIKDAADIIEPAVQAFKDKKIRNVYLAYTKFYSSVKQEVKIKKLLPFKARNENKGKEIEFDPSLDKILEYVFPRYLNTYVYYALLNSIASEYAIRMTAMDGATKNADDILNKLKLVFNRVRQSGITQEITEIVSGAEVLKD